MFSEPTTFSYESISAVMNRDFDSPFEVHEDGTVTDRVDVYAPELFGNSEPGGRETVEGWELVTDGYTGQHGYNGPILHNSESCSEGMAKDILEIPGVYVYLICYWHDEYGEDAWGVEADDGPYAEGWAIARMKGEDQ